MASRPKFIDDLAGMAGGAFSALSGLGEEIEQLVRTRIDETLARLRVVRRDEFDAVAELAANARAGEEDARAQLAALTRRVAALEGGGADASSESHGGPADPHLNNEGAVGGPPPADVDETEAHPS